jgi:hypothetical protein
MAISLGHPWRMAPKSLVVSVPSPFEQRGEFEVPWYQPAKTCHFVLVIAVERLGLSTRPRPQGLMAIAALDPLPRRLPFPHLVFPPARWTCYRCLIPALHSKT